MKSSTVRCAVHGIVPEDHLNAKAQGCVDRGVPVVYALAANEGFVSVGVDHDTPGIAVRSIEAWWSRVGARRYPEAVVSSCASDSIVGAILPARRSQTRNREN
jgi:hypothetical protein